MLDPLSGVMALSLTDIASPCDQKLPIYDGKQRFDLVFTPLAPLPARDHVCDVRLVPISGHKPGEGADSVDQRQDRARHAAGAQGQRRSSPIG